jgi:hypothetical protein
MAYRRRDQLRGGRPFLAVLTIWFAAFSYAAAIAIARRAIEPPLFGFAEFCLPPAIGIWLMTRQDLFVISHARIARALLILGTIAGAYGIIQYVLAPPWDTAWLQNIDATAFGTPERFGIRVFSLLNGPEIFGLFIVTVILFNLPYLRATNYSSSLAMLIMTIALMLSMFRTAWLAVLLGVTVFAILSPDRLKTISKLAWIIAACTLGVIAALVISPDASAGDKISQRLTTLGDVQDDYSLQERDATRQETIQKALDRPLGAGLGATGITARLASPDVQAANDVPDRSIDNGFAARFVEMGALGFSGFLCASFLSLTVLIRRYIAVARSGERMETSLVASCIAVQIAIFTVNFSDDDARGLLGVIFFAALALPLLPYSTAARDSQRLRLRHTFGRTPVRPEFL